MFLGLFFKRLRAEIGAALEGRTSGGASPPSAACGGTARTRAHGMPKPLREAKGDNGAAHGMPKSLRGAKGDNGTGFAEMISTMTARSRAAPWRIWDQRDVLAGKISASSSARGSPSGPRECVPVVLVG